jgi:amino acid transporter
MRALKARKISRDVLPYKAPLQPYLAWYGLFVNILIIFTQGFTAWIPSFSVENFFVAYISVILFAVLWIGHKLIFRDAFVSPLQADLDTGRLEVENQHWEVTMPTTWYGKLWNILAG